jgi:methylaspartate ammonia-lyase
MKIMDAVCSKGRTGFFFDDQMAIKAGAEKSGEFYRGKPVTSGFESIRQAGESISILLMLEDGSVATGDCAAVQYSGTGGRDPLFTADRYVSVIEKYIFPMLVGREIVNFRETAGYFDKMINPETGRRFHTAIRYGLSQALLDAAAKNRRTLMAKVVADDYGTTVSRQPITIFGQTGDNRYDTADRIIMKGAGSLPHGLINNVAGKLGSDGSILIDYVKWLSKRIEEIGGVDYKPVIHIDVYGTIGIAFGGNTQAMAEYLMKLKKAAGGLLLRVEGPMDMGEREAQANALAELTARIDVMTKGIQIVADEWCNTLEDIRYFADMKAGHMLQIKTPDMGGINNTAEAVLYCKDKGIGAYQGGTCNETDVSARACVHVAMAVKPDIMLAKPGMGFDEGYMIVYNEMQRILALAGRLE